MKVGSTNPLSDTYLVMIAGFRNYPLWTRLGLQEIKRRYKRTFIGPFWTTISLGVFILTLGFLWAHLWNQDVGDYLPYLTAGMVIWITLQTVIIEGCETFTSPSSKYLIESLNFPYMVLPCAVVWRNLIVFFHNIIIFVLVAIYAKTELNWNTFLVLPALLFIFINSIWVATVLGICCARFRDIRQVIVSILQVLIFITPIFWSADQLEKRLINFVDFNVLYHFIEIVRAPLLGMTASKFSWQIVIITTIFGVIIMYVLYGKFRYKLPYWL